MSRAAPTRRLTTTMQLARIQCCFLVVIITGFAGALADAVDNCTDLIVYPPCTEIPEVCNDPLASAYVCPKTCQKCGFAGVLPVATDNCTDLIVSPPCTEIPEVCNDPFASVYVCPKTCHKCGFAGAIPDTTDNCTDLIVYPPCTEIPEVCNDPLASAYVCPKTCQKCGFAGALPVATDNCIDNIVYPPCTEIPEVCNDPFASVFLCPKTCQKCGALPDTTDNCTDHIVSPPCTEIPEVCNDPFASVFLCPKTCQKCEASVLTPNQEMSACTDQAHDCNHTMCDDILAKQLCALTCGVCDKESQLHTCYDKIDRKLCKLQQACATPVASFLCPATCNGCGINFTLSTTESTSHESSITLTTEVISKETEKPSPTTSSSTAVSDSTSQSTGDELTNHTTPSLVTHSTVDVTKDFTGNVATTEVTNLSVTTDLTLTSNVSGTENDTTLSSNIMENMSSVTIFATSDLTSPPTTTALQTPATTNPKHLTPSACNQCGNLDGDLPCTDEETLLAESSPCNEDTPYCMNDIIQTNGYMSMYKRCVNETICNAEWYMESSDKQQCTQFDPAIYTDDLICHLCCYGDDCNVDNVPQAATLYKP